MTVSDVDKCVIIWPLALKYFCDFLKRVIVGYFSPRLQRIIWKVPKWRPTYSLASAQVTYVMHRACRIFQNGQCCLAKQSTCAKFVMGFQCLGTMSFSIPTQLYTSTVELVALLPCCVTWVSKSIGLYWSSGKLLSNGLTNCMFPHVPAGPEEVHFLWLMASSLCTVPFKIFFFPLQAKLKNVSSFSGSIYLLSH